MYTHLDSQTVLFIEKYNLRIKNKYCNVEDMEATGEDFKIDRILRYNPEDRFRR